MKRYAKGLSVFGFVLAAWIVYALVRDLWQDWNFERESGLDTFPDLVGPGLSLLRILQLVGASVLLRRLARPAPAGSVVRGLARFWVTFTLCMVGFHSWAAWELASTLHYLDVNPYRLIGLWGVVLVVASFWIGSLPPLWSLSGRPR